MSKIKLSIEALQAKMRGGETAAVPTTAPAQRVVVAAPTTPYDQHKEEFLAFCAAGVELLGEDAFAAGLDKAINYSRGDDLTSFIERLDKAIDRLPRAKGDKLREQLGGVARYRGIPTRAGDLRCAQDALEHVGEYLRRKRELEREAQRMLPPEYVPGEGTWSYKARLEEWAQAYSPAALRAAKLGDLYGVAQEAHEKWEREESQKRQQAAGALLEQLVGDYEAGRADWPDPDYGTHESGLFELSAFRPRLGATARAWREGRGIGEPPMGWAGLSEESLLAYGSEAACAEVRRRAGVGHDSQRVVVRGEFCYVAGHKRVESRLQKKGWDDHPLPADGVYGFTPAPEGWFVPSGGTHLVLVHWKRPELYVAYQRVLAAPKGNLDVSRMVCRWGRHPEKGFGRFSAPVYRTSITVAVDDALAPLLDDLRTLHDADALPEGACWLRGSVVPTQAGGLRVAAQNAAAPEALLDVVGHESRNGRHGFSGAFIAPSPQNRALCRSATSSSNGGGQSGSGVVAVVRPGVPLLLNTGVGYEIRGRELFRVAGLGTVIGGREEKV